MGLAVFRDLLAFQHLKAIALEDLCPAPRFKGHHLSIDLTHTLAAKMIEVAVHQLGGIGQPLRLVKDVEMEMGAASGSRRHFAPGVAQDPADEVAGGAVVEGVLRHAACEEGEIIEEVEELLTKRTVRAQQIAFDDPLLLQNKGGLRLYIRVVAGQVIGKELPILKDRVDRLAQKSSLAAEVADRLPILRFIAPDDDGGGRSGFGNLGDACRRRGCGYQ